MKRQYSGLFRASDEITLSNRALAYMVMELARYNFSRSDVDAKGAAYQEIVGANLRGDRGQYFTPRRAVDLVVRILDPKENEKVLDPASGTGGFLVANLAHQLRRFRAEYKREPGDKTQEALHDRLRTYAEKQLFGADFDPFLVRASTMNVLMAANTEGHIFHMDSLAFPIGHLPGNDLAKQPNAIPFGSVDVLMTNPPFGSEIPITERAILENNPLARKVTRGPDGQWLEQTATQNAVAPEILFIAQSVKWLRPGGRMGIVLPNGILGNPGDEHIRRWILRHCWVLACVEVPVEAFIVEANVGILTSLLFLKKKTDTEMNAEGRLRDELRFRVADGAVEISHEYLFLLPQDRALLGETPAGMWGDSEFFDSNLARRIISRASDNVSFILPEVGRRTEPNRANIPTTTPALSGAPLDLGLYAATGWFRTYLGRDILPVNLDLPAMRKPQRPLLSDFKVAPDGTTLPWSVLALEKKPAAYQEWIDHISGAVPFLAKVWGRTQEADNHAYLEVTYDTGYFVRSVGLTMRPVSTLVLEAEQKALLHQVHEVSDWVFTIDKSLGIEFFDHDRTTPRPEYLIDHSPDLSANSGRRVVITSRSQTEIRVLFERVLADYGLDAFQNRSHAILGELRALSGRLALKLISSPTHRAEALGLALGKLFLEFQDAFRDQAVIPLDAHLDLYRALQKNADEFGDEVSLRRTDLALFDFDAATMTLTCSLVEVKCYRAVGNLSGLNQLKSTIAEQMPSRPREAAPRSIA